MSLRSIWISRSSLTLAALTLAALTLACAPSVRTVPVTAAPAPSTPTPSTPAAATVTLASPVMGLQRDPALAAALDLVSADSIRATDSTLVAFGTRHTMSDTLSPTRGIGAARRWLYGKLAGYSARCGNCLRVQYQPAMITLERSPEKPTVNVVNVLAWLPGRDTSRVVVIGGHYDSCICNTDRWDATSNAPGADDDGSGTSAVVELARIFSERFPRGLDATVIFALYGAEEQGLLGSNRLAEWLQAQGYQVTAALTNDIVGNVSAEDGRTDSTSVRIFAADPDNGPSRELGRYAWATSLIYDTGLEVLPVWRLDRIHRGGDHIPFVRRGDAGLRVTERLENYKRQHLPTDALSGVNFGYVADVARLDASLVGSLAMAPAVPDSATAERDAASGGQKWMLRWQPSPHAASYEVLVRSTTSPVWERVTPVGTATSYLLPYQLDDVWAGVRAVDADGHRSLAAVVPPPAFVTR